MFKSNGPLQTIKVAFITTVLFLSFPRYPWWCLIWHRMALKNLEGGEDGRNCTLKCPACWGCVGMCECMCVHVWVYVWVHECGCMHTTACGVCFVLQLLDSGDWSQVVRLVGKHFLLSHIDDLVAKQLSVFKEITKGIDPVPAQKRVTSSRSRHQSPYIFSCATTKSVRI